MSTRIKVWDAPTRVFHWLMVLSFAVAYFTAESERWRLVHVTFGYTLGALVVFRLVWGVAGTRYARFAGFVTGPAQVVRYLKSLLTQSPEHHIGHNPAGAVAIVALLALGLLQLCSGWAVYNDWGGEWLEELHELSANAMLAVIAVHVAGVASASFMHRENLVRAMVTGFKNGLPAQGIVGTRRWVALLLMVGALAFWWYQWQSAPGA